MANTVLLSVKKIQDFFLVIVTEVMKKPLLTQRWQYGAMKEAKMLSKTFNSSMLQHLWTQNKQTLPYKSKWMDPGRPTAFCTI